MSGYDYDYYYSMFSDVGDKWKREEDYYDRMKVKLEEYKTVKEIKQEEGD